MQKQKLPAQYFPALAEYGLSWLDPSNAVLIRYDRCEWMLLAEQEIGYLFILLSGKAKVCMGDESGRNLLLCYYVSEGVMGDIELMMGRKEAISSVQAVTPVVCIGLPLQTYADAMLSHLPFVLRVAKGLSIKLHASVASTTEIILRPFEARLSGYLLQSAQGGVRFIEIITGQTMFGTGKGRHKDVRAAGNKDMMAVDFLTALIIVNLHRMRIENTCHPLAQLDTGLRSELLGMLGIAPRLYLILVLHDGCIVRRRWLFQTQLGAETPRCASQGRHLPHRLGWHTALIETVATHHPFGIYHEHLVPRPRQSKRRWIRRATSPDTEQIHHLFRHI